jgi:hypothetical protein
MKEVIKAMLNALFAVMNEEQIRLFADKGLDKLEEVIAASPNTWDDTVLLPVINHARKLLNITEDDPLYADKPPE